MVSIPLSDRSFGFGWPAMVVEEARKDWTSPVGRMYVSVECLWKFVEICLEGSRTFLCISQLLLFFVFQLTLWL